MIPRIYHLTAPTKTLTWEEGRIQARLRRMLPDWEAHLWDDADNSALMRSAFPHLASRYEAIRFGVMKADIARCAYLHAYGGFYFDTDYKLLQPMPAEWMRADCVLPIEEGAVGSDDFKVGNAVFGSKAGHPLWAAFLAHVFEADSPETLDDHRRIPSITGPRGLTLFYNAHRERFPDIAFPPRSAFHPERTWFGLSQRGDAGTVGTHLCWASWRGKTKLRAISNFARRKLTAPF